MSRYIDADSLKNSTGNFVFQAILDSAPTADVVEVVRGRNVSESNPVDKFECSICGSILEGYTEIVVDDHDNDRSNREYEFNFCPNCGADMRKETHHE